MLLVDYDKCQPALADKRYSNYFKTDRRKKAQPETDCAFLKTGTPTGNRTPVTAVKGRCPNR